jgi:hypothetical protein
MRKIIVLYSMFVFSIIAYANTSEYDEEYEEIYVEEIEDSEKDENMNPHKSIYRPHVYYCNGKIQIASTYNIYNMVVVLRSQTGNVAYSVNIPVLYGFYSITLSPDVIDEAYSIELIYPSHHLIGYF